MAVRVTDAELARWEGVARAVVALIAEVRSGQPEACATPCAICEGAWRLPPPAIPGLLGVVAVAEGSVYDGVTMVRSRWDTLPWENWSA